MSKPNTLTPGDYDTLQMIGDHKEGTAWSPRVLVHGLIFQGLVETAESPLIGDILKLTAAGILALRDDPKGEIRPPSQILQYFECAHLPPKLRAVSQHFEDVAKYMDKTLPPGVEKSAGLRKLLEAKDCMVRAAL